MDDAIVRSWHGVIIACVASFLFFYVLFFAFGSLREGSGDDALATIAGF